MAGQLNGIVVDDTVHWLSKYVRARDERGLSVEGSIRYAFRNVGTAIVVNTIILAAGQGKRMRSNLPKVLQPLAGRPLLGHVLDCAAALHSEDVCVVHGHGADAVRAAFPGEAVRWSLQAEQLGTGHAVQQAMPGTPDENRVLVLFGDVPLLTPATCRRLVDDTPEGDVGETLPQPPLPTGPAPQG